MKMMGNIIELDKNNKLGYIKGFDDLIYFFHQNQVYNNENLKINDLVEFDFEIKIDKNMPYAIDIKRKSK